jgi:hypothetical protein
LQPVQVSAPASLIGDIAAVTITEVSSNSLFGTLAQEGVNERAHAPALATAGV